MKFYNTEVYGLNNSIKASSYPMSTDIIRDYDVITENDLKRSKKLGSAKPNSGHDCFLKGIIVQFDLCAPAYIWLQIMRYHFQDIISSQSKMHKIQNMDLDKQCNTWVLKEIKNICKSLILFYNNYDWNTNKNVIWDDGISYTKQDFFHLIISNLPQGLELTARMTSNYLQLKTIYLQRKNHKLYDWNDDFLNWVNGLPMFKELINN